MKKLIIYIFKSILFSAIIFIALVVTRLAIRIVYQVEHWLGYDFYQGETRYIYQNRILVAIFLTIFTITMIVFYTLGKKNKN